MNSKRQSPLFNCTWKLLWRINCQSKNKKPVLSICCLMSTGCLSILTIYSIFPDLKTVTAMKLNLSKSFHLLKALLKTMPTDFQM
jgi:hypothetical protein